MEIGEQHLPFLEHLHFVRLRLFDFHDHLSFRKDVFGQRNDRCPLVLELAVEDARAFACTSLDQDLVAAIGELTYSDWRERHAMLFGLDLSRHTDDHRHSLLRDDGVSIGQARPASTGAYQSTGNSSSTTVGDGRKARRRPAASTKPAKRGWGASGRERNSG